MTVVLAASGIDLTTADIVAGSALFVGLGIGVLGFLFRYRAALIAGGIIALCVAVFLITSLRETRAEGRFSAIGMAVFVLAAGIVLLVFNRSPKK